MSSGAESPLKIRSPHDIINLAQLVGLSGAAAAGVVGKNPAKAIKMAQFRRQAPCRSAVDIGISLRSGRMEAAGLEEELLLTPNKTDDNDGKQHCLMEYMELSDESSENDRIQNDDDQ